MTSDTAWIEEARRLLDAGTPVAIVCRAIGKSETAVRHHLNINGRADKAKARNASIRTGGTGHFVGRPNKEPRPRKSDAAPARPEPRPVSLPALSFLANAVEEAKPAFRFAPKTHCRIEQPGVTRIKRVEAEMIRRGKLPSRAEMHS